MKAWLIFKFWTKVFLKKLMVYFFKSMKITKSMKKEKKNHSTVFCLPQYLIFRIWTAVSCQQYHHRWTAVYNRWNLWRNVCCFHKETLDHYYDFSTCNLFIKSLADLITVSFIDVNKAFFNAFKRKFWDCRVQN